MRKINFLLVVFGIVAMFSVSSFAGDITMTPNGSGGFSYHNYKTGESGTIQPDGFGGYIINNNAPSHRKTPNNGMLGMEDIWRIPNKNAQSRLQNEQQRLQNKLLELQIRELQKELKK